MRNDKTIRTAHLGIYFVDLESGEVILNYNEHKLFIPASVMKLFSTLLAWEVLGEDFKYETKIYIPKGSQPPCVKGDIVIKGSGDPSLNHVVLEKHLVKFKEDGFQRVEGNLVIDNTAFNKERWSTRWPWDLNDNPHVDALIVQNRVHGFNPYNEDEVALYAGEMVRETLQRFDIQLQSVKVGRLEPEIFEEFITIRSQPLKELIRVANKVSHNSYAEQIFRTVGLKLFGIGSNANAVKALNQLVDKIVGEDYPRNFADGCGLSMYNLVSPYMTVKLLEYAYKKCGGLNGFISTLAVAGKDGTLAKRLAGYQVYGKTGTLAYCASLAGVAITKFDRKVAFAIFVNNYSGQYPKDQIDSIVRWVCDNY
ncbi:D-alanyl-D-alanine carboxypeptidase/D-alanyl-D-alanine-endopeptidase [Pseudothermotoga sp.]|nr:D-alanyl-D-alanine carboxypeptidase [Pseudothermotoga sp.]MCX7812401.1 D-alanyl-D-alanine carboxypeptidase [Pseudothermotoga sp.]MDW8140145.1 D-alanyl-D-alanine carboxypeptidase [Pseudothermotoga sp.]